MQVVYKNIHTGKFFNWDKYYERIDPNLIQYTPDFLKYDNIKKQDVLIKDASIFDDYSENWKFVHYFNKNYTILNYNQRLIDQETTRTNRKSKLKKLFKKLENENSQK